MNIHKIKKIHTSICKEAFKQFTIAIIILLSSCVNITKGQMNSPEDSSNINKNKKTYSHGYPGFEDMFIDTDFDNWAEDIKKNTNITFSNFNSKLNKIFSMNDLNNKFCDINIDKFFGLGKNNNKAKTTNKNQDYKSKTHYTSSSCNNKNKESFSYQKKYPNIEKILKSYSILKVNNKSTEQEIKKAYKNLAKKYHPDKNKGSREMNEKFIELSEAYDCLKLVHKFN